MERRLHLTFPKNLIKEPVIYRVGHKFRVVTNIRRANVSEDAGWVVLGMEGEPEEIEKAIAYLRQLGVRVDTVEKNVVE